MRAFSVVPYPHLLQPQAPPAGELVAATPLGKDEQGKNLVAYIMRTEEETAIRHAALYNANSNDPRLKAAPPPDPRVNTKPETAARFIKPDQLLSRFEQAQLEQLRARDADIRQDATALEDMDGNSLLAAFVYDKGPDGRRYAVGVAAPLMAQKAETGKAPPPLPEGALNPHIRASMAYRHSAAQDAEGPKAGLLDRAL